MRGGDGPTAGKRAFRYTALLPNGDQPVCAKFRELGDPVIVALARTGRDPYCYAAERADVAGLTFNPGDTFVAAKRVGFYVGRDDGKAEVRRFDSEDAASEFIGTQPGAAAGEWYIDQVPHPDAGRII